MIDAAPDLEVRPPGRMVRRVALHAASNASRRRGREERALGRVDVAETTTELLSADEALWRAVRELPDQQRWAMVLHYVEDRPVAEVAAVLECSEGTVKTHLSRARATLALAGGHDEAVEQKPAVTAPVTAAPTVPATAVPTSAVTMNPPMPVFENEPPRSASAAVNGCSGTFGDLAAALGSSTTRVTRLACSGDDAQALRGDQLISLHQFKRGRRVAGGRPRVERGVPGTLPAADPVHGDPPQRPR
jgi:Sigma-70, region 4